MSTQLPLFRDTAPLPTDKCHVSYSELSVWRSCAFKHKLLYIDKTDREPENTFSIFGSIFHDTIDSWLHGSSSHHKVHPDVVDGAVAEFEKRALACENVTLESITTWKHELQGLLYESIPWLNDQFPGWTLMGSEIPLFESISPGRWFKGFVDFLIKLPDGSMVVGDWKTSVSGWDEKKTEDQVRVFQLALYRSFLIRKLGLQPEKVQAGWAVLNRDKCTIQWIGIPNIQDHTDAAMTALKTMIASIERGWFFKNRSSCGFCPFAFTPRCPP